MKTSIPKLFAALVVVNLAAFSANAAITGFVGNPTSNSVDWGNYVTGQGGGINSNVNFDAHPLGPLLPNFYLGSDGVTLTPVGDVNTVLFGAGPGQGNTFTPPLSNGEGPHLASRYLFDGAAASSLTVSFSSPVLGAGFFVIDYFNPQNNNSLLIQAYAGPNGTGALLGSFSSKPFNFQPNHKYFMGVASDTANIGSIKYIDVNNVTGDTTGIDDILFATPVPEPSTYLAGALLLLPFVGSTIRSLRNRRHHA